MPGSKTTQATQRNKLNGKCENRCLSLRLRLIPTEFMKKVLITGATGATGGNAIKKLLELEVPLRALVHKVDERSEKLSSQGVEIVRGDLSDFEAVSEALQGITAAYFVFPVKVPGILEATAFFAQAALEQGVGAIVNMSRKINSYIGFALMGFWWSSKKGLQGMANITKQTWTC
jgi:hypothetical protein